jgi:hypothetical protein
MSSKGYGSSRKLFSVHPLYYALLIGNVVLSECKDGEMLESWTVAYIPTVIVCG